AGTPPKPGLFERARGSDRAECASLPSPCAKLLTKAAAFGQVADQALGQERLGPPVGGPLELFVTLVHVVDQVLHPEQRVPTVSHRCGSFPVRSSSSANARPDAARDPLGRPCRRSDEGERQRPCRVPSGALGMIPKARADENLRKTWENPCGNWRLLRL